MDKTMLSYSNIIRFTKAQSIETKTKKNWQEIPFPRIGPGFKFYESSYFTGTKKYSIPSADGAHCRKAVGELEDWG